MIQGFYSDPHFGHSNIIKYESRPFTDFKEMNEELIRRYNEKVGHNDTIFWLGDCFLMPFNLASGIMSRLNGTKILTPGNHDRSVKAMLSIGFHMVVPEGAMLIGGHKCRFSHYPYRTKKEVEAGVSHKRPVRSSGKNEILIHGHTHGKKRRHDDMIHVGVDAWDYGPVMIGEIEELL